MVALKKLGPPAQAEAYRFCEARPDQAAFIAGWLHEGGLEGSTTVPRAWLLGDLRGRSLGGVVYVSSSGIVIPVLERAIAADAIEELARSNPSLVRVLVGERTLIAEIWERLERRGAGARLSRDQLGYAVERPSFVAAGETLSLEVSGARHLEQVVSASAAMAREEANDDPQARNPELFRSRISERIARGRDFVHMSGTQLAFKCNVAALSPSAGQVEGIYTTPSFRGAGVGARGTSTVTRWVLDRATRAVLLVNEDNLVARRLYERIGYRPTMYSRTIFLAP